MRSYHNWVIASVVLGFKRVREALRYVMPYYQRAYCSGIPLEYNAESDQYDLANSEQVGRSRCDMLRHVCDDAPRLNLVSLGKKLLRTMCQNGCEKFMVDVFEFVPCVGSKGFYFFGSKMVEHIGYTGLISLYLTFRDF